MKFEFLCSITCCKKNGLLLFRWVERINGIIRMLQSFIPTHTAIKKIANATSTLSEDRFQGVPWDTNTKTMAKGLQCVMENFKFLMCLVVTKEVFSYLAPITTGLQGLLL